VGRSHGAVPASPAPRRQVAAVRLSGHLSVADTKVGPAPVVSDTDVRTSMTGRAPI